MNSLLDDILFCMDPVGGAGQLAGFDRDEAAALLDHYLQFIEAEIAPINQLGDQQGAELKDGRVFLPEEFASAYQQFAEQGWMALGLPESHGGQPVPGPLLAGFSEILSGANQSFQMIVGLVPGAARILDIWGNDQQKHAWLDKLSSGDWLATMNLTEPQAGSDLARIRTRAEPVPAPQGDGMPDQMLDWQISGQKIFISGGDQNMSHGILHLVLARTGAMEEGVKGLSLFAVPDQLADGRRNQLHVARLEEKMGIHASPTCEMVFEQARASLIGKAGDGLKMMFVLMNHARLDVGLQGVAHAARSHLLAADYAAGRIQGRLDDGRDARLIDHGDIQRMLDEQQILALGARSICHIAASALDNPPADHEIILAMLTSLAKVFGSQAGIKAADLGIQILGGYGYLREYKLEQHYRDARITAIYEGANGIHARTLAFRLNRQPGATEKFAAFLDRLAAGKSAELIRKWQIVSQQLASADDARTAALADDFMQATGQLLTLCVWYRLDEQAPAHPEPARIRRLAGRVFASHPHLLAARLAILADQLA